MMIHCISLKASMFYVLLYVTLSPFLYCNHLDGEERAVCFAYFVFLVSSDG